MGHYCRLCGYSRPNEQFTGKGHKKHICKSCSRMPKQEQESKLHLEELYDMYNQSNISKKNITRLQRLKMSEIKEVSELAGLIYEVAREFPRKKGRFKYLISKNKELLIKLSDAGLEFYFQNIYLNQEVCNFYIEEDEEDDFNDIFI